MTRLNTTTSAEERTKTAEDPNHTYLQHTHHSIDLRLSSQQIPRATHNEDSLVNSSTVEEEMGTSCYSSAFTAMLLELTRPSSHLGIHWPWTNGLVYVQAHMTFVLY